MVLVGSQLLEHNLTDVGLVWENIEQAIAKLYAIRDSFLLRQAGHHSYVGLPDRATNDDEHAIQPSSGHG